MNDTRDSLSRTLQDWRVAPPADPNFRPDVWRRISRRSRESWGGYVRAHLVSWSLAAVVAISIAGLGGRAAGKARLDAAREAMATAYLVELDPRVQAKLRP